MKPVFLIGFMGTGKSITGKKLALHFGSNFIDLDSEIERISNMKISDIFKELGEEYFRKIESEILKSVTKDNSIISCGGGTPCFHNNLDYINNHGVSIYLKTNRGILISRLIHNKSKRPLLADKMDTDLLKYINDLIDYREPFYLRANHIFQMDKKKINDLIELININT